MHWIAANSPFLVEETPFGAGSQGFHTGKGYISAYNPNSDLFIFLKGFYLFLLCVYECVPACM